MDRRNPRRGPSGCQDRSVLGAGAPDNPNEKAFLQAAEISKFVAADELLRERVRIHLRSTGSHSKLIIADDGDEGYVAVVGSCNWLYTSFDRFELSCEFRDPRLIAEIAEAFGAMVARPGFKPEIGTELYILARSLRRRPESTGNHRARVIAGQAHEAILREASGSRPSRFLVASDKFGNSAFANAIIPAEVAAATARTEPVVIYGSTAGLVSGLIAAGMTIDVRERGVRLLRISEGSMQNFFCGATMTSSSPASTGVRGPRRQMPHSVRLACTYRDQAWRGSLRNDCL